MTYEFVERVVSAHVFGCMDEISEKIKESATVNPARLVKVRLLGPQCIWQGVQYIRLNFPLGLGSSMLHCCSTASMDVLPHTPQLEVV